VPSALVFDATALDSLDITSAEMLEKLVTKLHAGGIELVVAEAHAVLPDRGRGRARPRDAGPNGAAGRHGGEPSTRAEAS